MSLDDMKKEYVLVRRLLNVNIVPGCFSAAMLVAGNLIDASVIGRCLGKTALAAFGISNPLVFGILGLAGMLGIGAVIGLGDAIGKADREKMDRVLSTSLCSGMAAGLIIMTMMLLFSSGIARMMGADAQLLREAGDYLTGYAFGVPAFFVYMILNYVMPIDSDRNRCVWALIISTAVNISLDLLNGYILHWGLLGMGLATSVSVYAELIVLLLHFGRKEKMLRLSFLPFSPSILVSSIKNGLPFALQLLFKMLAIVLVNRIIVAVSDNETVAVFSVLISCNNLITIDATAVGVSTLTIDSCFAGEQDGASMSCLISAALKHAIITNLLLTVLFELAAPLIVKLFVTDASFYAACVPAFRLYVTNIVFFAVNFILRSHLQSMKCYIISILYSCVEFLIAPIAAALAVVHILGVDEIWIYCTIGEAAAFALFLLYICILRKRIPLCFNDYLLLPPELRSEEGECLDYVIENKEGAINECVCASEQAIIYLKAHGMQHRDAMLMGVIVEELCKNVVEHGFSSTKDIIEMRISRKNGSWQLRIRDNCRYFNVKEYFNLVDKNSEKYGLQIVKGLAGQVEYMSALQINRLIVRMDEQKLSFE